MVHTHEILNRQRCWRMALVVLALIAGGVRGLHLYESRDSPRRQVLIGDAGRYHEWAVEIASGEWLGSGTFYQAPLYPYCLAAVYAAFGPQPALALWVQAAWSTLACVLLACAGAKFFGRRAGWLAGVLLALWPAEVFHVSLLEKTALTTCLMAALLRALAFTLRSPRRMRTWCAAGAAMGLLALVRENTLVLPLLTLAWIVWFPRHALAARNALPRRQAALALLLGCLVPLAPVLVRNRVVGGEWRLTTAQFGPNFYIGNSASADGSYLELVVDHGTPAHEQSDATAIAAADVGRELTPGEVSAWWTRQTLQGIGANPGRWLRLLAQKVVLTWTDVELADSEDQYTAASDSRTLRALMRVFSFGRLAALAVFGLVVLGPLRRRTWILPASLATYTLSISLFYLFARYRLPLVPVLALLAGAGLVRCSAWMRQWWAASRLAATAPNALGTQRRGAGRMLCAVSAGLIAWVVTIPRIVAPLFPDWPDLSVARMRAVTEFNVGLRLWDQSADLAVVETHFAAAVAWNPDYASAWLYWGRVLIDRNQHAAALEKLQQAAISDPERAEIRLELGDLWLQLDRPADALPPLRVAVELAADDVDAQHLLGRALYLTGDRAAAVEPLTVAVELDPGFIEARRLLAIALDQTGRPEEAHQEFQELLQQVPTDHPEADFIRRRLAQRRTPLRKTPSAQ